jgi:hypothetical protein
MRNGISAFSRGSVELLWISLIAAWVLGSAGLYLYLVKTAREPRHPECMDCHKTDCAGCPVAIDSPEQGVFRKAA